MKKLLMMLLVVGLTATAALEGLTNYLDLSMELQKIRSEYEIINFAYEIYEGGVSVTIDDDISNTEMGWLEGLWLSMAKLAEMRADTADMNEHNTVVEGIIKAVTDYLDGLIAGEESFNSLRNSFEETFVGLSQTFQDEASTASWAFMWAAQPPLRSDAYVQHVINANTFYCPGLGNVRLLYVDVPMVDDANYDIATERLRELVEGQVVTLTFDVSGSGITDDEGTILAMPVVGGVNVCQTLVAEHLVEPTILPPETDLIDWPPE